MTINRYFSIFILAVALLPFATAAQIYAEYQIVDKTVVVKLIFEEVSDLKLKIPYDVKALELNIENYKIEDFENYKLLDVDYAKNLSIKYLTKSFIENSGGRYFFVMENPFAEKANVKIYLPESAILGEKILVFPEGADIDSDGRRIILEWADYNDEQILVGYEFVEKDLLIFYIIIGILIIILFSGYLLEKRKLKNEIQKIRKISKEKNMKSMKKGEEAITRNLIEDEKRIAEYLLNKEDNESWTKEIMKDLGISKVKLSRKLRSLEQKEIIKKIPYGNENKIKLIKKE